MPVATATTTPEARTTLEVRTTDSKLNRAKVNRASKARHSKAKVNRVRHSKAKLNRVRHSRAKLNRVKELPAVAAADVDEDDSIAPSSLLATLSPKLEANGATTTRVRKNSLVRDEACHVLR